MMLFSKGSSSRPGRKPTICSSDWRATATRTCLRRRSANQDAADFVTVRVPKGNLGAPVMVEKNYHIRVHGFLQSRDYQESLADFLKDARGAELPVPATLDQSVLRVPRGTTEVIERWLMLGSSMSRGIMSQQSVTKR